MWRLRRTAHKGQCRRGHRDHIVTVVGAERYGEVMEDPHLDLQRPEQLSPISAEQFISDPTAEGRLLESAVLEDAELRDANLVECVVEGMTVLASDLTGLNVVESSIERLNAPELRCSRSSWRSVSLTGSRIGAAELYDAEWSSVRVSGSKLDLVNLRGSRLHDVLLENCQIGELDLGTARVRRLALRDCTVETLVLSGAQLKDVDLRGADLRRITGIEHLRGAIISAVQLQELAAHLAAQMGISVSD